MAKTTTLARLVNDFMLTGLNDADAVAWREYCVSEGTAFSPEKDEIKGVKVSGKEEKGKVTVKGGERKTESVRINAALLALALATAVRDTLDSTGFGGAKADVSAICAEWKARRDAKKAAKDAPKPEPAPQNA